MFDFELASGPHALDNQLGERREPISACGEFMADENFF
jgi:hypothetical protein